MEIPDKAKLDEDYVKRISFTFDVKCFIGTIFSVAKSDGAVEGGTGTIHSPIQPNDGKTLYGEDGYQINK